MVGATTARAGVAQLHKHKPSATTFPDTWIASGGPTITFPTPLHRQSLTVAASLLAIQTRTLVTEISLAPHLETTTLIFCHRHREEILKPVKPQPATAMLGRCP